MTQDAFRSQRELLAIISTANPHQLDHSGDKWATFSQIALDAADHVQERLTRLTAADGWTGVGSLAYAARITTDLIEPLRRFASNAAAISDSLRTLSTAVTGAVDQALANPIPWDEQVCWRVEQKRVQRNWFVDEDETIADQAYENAQSDAPYQIKTGTGVVCKEIPKPTWQQTVSAVGSPPVPAVFKAAAVGASSDVVRFDALMEYQDMNVARRQALRFSTEQVNECLARMLPVDKDGDVAGLPEFPMAQVASEPGSVTSLSTPRPSASGNPDTGFGSATQARPVPSAPHGTASAGTGLASGSISSWGTGSGGLIDVARPAAPSTGTATASTGVMLPPPMMAGGGATSAGSDGTLSKRSGSSSGQGQVGFGAGTSGVVPPGGFGATGSNASFGMGSTGRGVVSAGNVGPVGNAQMGASGGGGGGLAAPMAPARTDDQHESDAEDVFLDEDLSIWDDANFSAVPSGEIN